MRIWTAFRAFFRTLLNAEFGEAVTRLLDGVADRSVEISKPGAVAAKRKVPVESVSKRNDAITLLAALQREARFVDLVKEPLGNFNDAQVGAAARDVLRDCGTVLDRFFDIYPASDQLEGSAVEVPKGFDGGQFQLKGAVTGEPPFRGSLVHHGWQAGKVELPKWSGKKSSLMIVAPIQVEIKGN